MDSHRQRSWIFTTINYYYLCQRSGRSLDVMFMILFVRIVRLSVSGTTAK